MRPFLLAPASPERWEVGQVELEQLSVGFSFLLLGSWTVSGAGIPEDIEEEETEKDMGPQLTQNLAHFLPPSGPQFLHLQSGCLWSTCLEGVCEEACSAQALADGTGSRSASLCSSPLPGRDWQATGLPLLF